MARILTEPFSRALVIEGPHPTLDDQLRSFGVEPVRLDEVPDEDTLIAALREHRAQILFKRSRVPVTRRVLESCPDLYVVQLCSIGTDSVDLEAAAEQGVLVFNDPVSNGRSVVELAISHMIALARRLYETDVAMHDHTWEKTASGRYEIHGKTLGIVGLGNIGRSVARVAQELGMEIQFYDSRPVAVEVGLEMGWSDAGDLDRLFRTSDIVTVHTSAKDSWGNDNAGFLNDVLGQLGADQPENSPRLFLNLARGNLYEPEVLLEAVDSGAIRRAAVDVYPDEPSPGQPSWENPYGDEPRITCTPHIGAATQEAQPRIARHVSGTQEGLSLFGSIRDCVFSPRAQMSVRDYANGNVVLAVVHSVARGTKKAVDDAIYRAEGSNLVSTHRDFDIGIAYDLNVMDRPLSQEALEELASHAKELANDPDAVKVIRQIEVPPRQG